MSTLLAALAQAIARGIVAGIFEGIADATIRNATATRENVSAGDLERARIYRAILGRLHGANTPGQDDTAPDSGTPHG